MSVMINDSVEEIKPTIPVFVETDLPLTDITSTPPPSTHRRSPSASTLSSAFIARNIAWAQSCGVSLATARLLAIQEAIIASSLRSRNSLQHPPPPSACPAASEDGTTSQSSSAAAMDEDVDVRSKTVFTSKSNFKGPNMFEKIEVCSTWSEDGTRVSRKLCITTVSEPGPRLQSGIMLSGRRPTATSEAIRIARHRAPSIPHVPQIPSLPSLNPSHRRSLSTSPSLRKRSLSTVSILSRRRSSAMYSTPTSASSTVPLSPPRHPVSDLRHRVREGMSDEEIRAVRKASKALHDAVLKGNLEQEKEVKVGQLCLRRGKAVRPLLLA